MAGSPGADFCHVFLKSWFVVVDLPVSRSGGFEEGGSLFLIISSLRIWFFANYG